jgi:DNA-directed RNA polymerase specialized sigma subunit
LLLTRNDWDVSLRDPIGTDKERNEITLIDILGSEADDVIDMVQLKIEKSKIYKNLDILDDREKEVVMGRFGLEHGEAHIALMGICAFLVRPYGAILDIINFQLRLPSVCEKGLHITLQK